MDIFRGLWAANARASLLHTLWKQPYNQDKRAGDRLSNSATIEIAIINQWSVITHSVAYAMYSTLSSGLARTFLLKSLGAGTMNGHNHTDIRTSSFRALSKWFDIRLAVLAATCVVHLAVAGSAHAADCNNNGIDDATEIAGGTTLDCNEDGVPDECQTYVISEDFNDYSPDDEPTDWFDTDTESSTQELVVTQGFRVRQVGPDLAFGTTYFHPNIHSHYVGPGAADLSDMTYTGRMRIDNPDGGVGVTFLSQFSDQPSSTYEYVRIRRANYAPSARTFHLAPPNFDNFVGTKDSGVNPSINTWYRFRVVIDTTGPQLHVQANFWEDGQPEPAGFQIDAVDPSGQHPTSGTVGVWSMGSGGKFWDDIAVYNFDPNLGVPCDDGDLCTTCDSTDGGPCVGIPVDCSHLDDDCNVGTCNATTGECETVHANEGGGCDDSDVCTTGDECASGVCTGTPVDCSSLDDTCVVGACNPSTGSCEASPNNERGGCDDLNTCTTNDECAGGVCAGNPIDCSHLNDGCTVGVCNQSNGQCESAPAGEGGACDDLDACTENDTCTGGVCAGTPLDCSAQDSDCLSASCNPDSGLCELPSYFDCNLNNVPDSCDLGLASQTNKFHGGYHSNLALEGFGSSVAIHGDRAVVGSPLDDFEIWPPGGDLFVSTDNGAAYKFRRTNDTWEVDGPVTFYPVDNAHIGSSVATDGESVFVGAPGMDESNPNQGEVYILWGRNSEGHLTNGQGVVASDRASGDEFGNSVSLSGDTGIIGAWRNDDGGQDSGSAYIFQLINLSWQQVIKLTADDAAAGDQFGCSVSISASTAIVGAYGDDDDGSESGSAYVFERIGGAWQQVAKLKAADASAEDRFGWSVSVDGITAIIGAYQDDDRGSDSGSSYIFRRIDGVWQQVAKLKAIDTTAGDQFGWSVAISGQSVVAGAVTDDDDGSDSGSAYLFREISGVWQQILKITANDAMAGDQFGFSVATDGESALVGAIREANGGASYVFDLPNFDCNSNGVPDECDVEAQTVDDCNLNGIPDECEFNGENSQDCSFLDSACLRGICNLEYGTCEIVPANPGATCDDLDLCTENDRCSDGICSGTAIDCSHLDNSCLLAACDPGTGQCEAPSSTIDCNSNGVPDECDFSIASQLDKLIADDAAADDEFGFSVTASGKTAIIGAPYESAGGHTRSGSAYVIRETNGEWQQVAKLSPNDASGHDNFGTSVSISGETAVIGSIHDDDIAHDNGSAYIFRVINGVWTQIAKLSADDAATNDYFGTSVATSGDLALIGAPENDDAGSKSGSAYIFGEVDGIWRQISKLTADDAAEDDRFGHSVAISGETAVIGAYRGSKDGVNQSGSAYVFRRTDGEWIQIAELTADDAAPLDRFGFSVAISEATIVIGSPRHSAGQLESGSVYIFSEIDGAWEQISKLSPDDPALAAEFGYRVSILKNYVVIGVPHDNEFGGRSGSVYVFGKSDVAWQQIVKLTPNDIAPDDRFGSGAAISGTQIIAGSRFDNDAGNDSGSVYVFALESEDCNDNGTLDECDIFGSTSNDCNANGIPDDCEATSGLFHLDISAVPATQVCPSEVITLSTTSGYFDYEWEPGSESGQSIQVTTPGVYRVNATNGPGQCSATGTIAVSFGGPDTGVPALLVSSKETDTVMAYDATTGQLIFEFASFATSGLDYPNGIAVDAAGNVYVASVGSASAKMYAAFTGELIREYTGTLTSPVGVAFAGSNRLLVSNWSDDSVHAFDVVTGQHLGQLVTTGAGGLDGPAGLLLAPSGELFVSSQSGDQVLAFDAESGAFNRVVAEGGGLDLPAGLLLNNEDNLVVASLGSDQVLLFDPSTGSVIEVLVEDDPSTLESDESAGLDGPEGLAWGADGQLLVSNRFGESVLEFDGVSGTFLRSLGTSVLDEPTYIALTTMDPDCNANRVADVCDELAAGDFDANGNVNILDYEYLADCQSGPNSSPDPANGSCEVMCLQVFDADSDGDIDLMDFASFTLTP